MLAMHGPMNVKCFKRVTLRPCDSRILCPNKFLNSAFIVLFEFLNVFLSLGIIYCIFTTSDNEYGDDFLTPLLGVKYSVHPLAYVNDPSLL